MQFDLQEHLRVSEVSGDESLLPELLHALSQPLTALRCSLELTLLQPRDSDEYRKRLKESLSLAEEVTTLTGGIRELLDTEKRRAVNSRIDFSKLLRMTFREFSPLALDKQLGFALSCSPEVEILGGEFPISRALFYLLDFMVSMSKAGDELAVRLGSEDAEVNLTFELTDGKEHESSRQRSKGCAAAKTYLAFLIARRTFEMEGGRVRVERTTERLSIEIKLKSASQTQILHPAQTLKSAS
jgi:hypothetical protein